MAKVRVDIDELMEKLTEMKDEGYVTSEIEVAEGDTEAENELGLSAIDIENDEPVHFGSLSNLESDM